MIAVGWKCHCFIRIEKNGSQPPGYLSINPGKISILLIKLEKGFKTECVITHAFSITSSQLTASLSEVVCGETLVCLPAHRSTVLVKSYLVQG